MKKISIIVPVYKVEPYIDKCLQSLLQQDLAPDEYEIICINDGSPDNAPAIISDYAAKYSNILLIDQQNQGVSAARNNGIEKASGEYLFFVDADDSLNPNCLKALYQQASTNKLDLLYARTDFVDTDDTVTGKMEMDNMDRSVIDGFNHQRRGFIFGLYNRKTVNGLRFFTGIPVGEDALFNIMMHAESRRVSYSDIPAYRYLTREGSASRAANLASEPIFLGNLKALELLKNFVDAHRSQFNAEQIAYFDRPFSKLAENIAIGSVIPILSSRRLNMLKSFLKENNLDYLTPRIAQTVKYFDKSTSAFLTYYSMRKVYFKFGFARKE